MRLEELRVVHYRKNQESQPGLARWFEVRAAVSDSFCMGSCLRWLWAGSAETLRAAEPPVELDVLAGEDAYRFLLRVTCGLESEIAGETDIFGQFKEAWKEAWKRGVRPEPLRPWMQRLFEDTKEIRSLYLQHMGGGSYGSLVRKLVQRHSGRGPVLLVGAGQLARSVAPFLENEEVWVWNRGAARLSELYLEMSSRPGARVRVLGSAEDELDGWRKAATVIVCIPADNERDPARVQAWNAGGGDADGRLLIHLGDVASRLGAAWREAKGLHALDEVFEMQKSQGEVRSVQVAQAARACVERAKLRALGASVSIPHGWEDLAAFA